MRLILLFLLSLYLPFLSLPVQAENNTENVALKKMVVLGTVPGPDLWKVSDGENVLWILGTLSPLPKKMDWNSKPIEEVVMSSQAFLLPPSFSLSLKDVGFFKKLSLARSAIGVKKNPKKQKLIDVLPADLYTRWLVLKKNYMGNSRKIEKTRPIFASNELFNKALKKTGLTKDTGVVKKLKKMAKKNDLEMIQSQVELNLEEPKSTLKKFKKAEINDLECFTKTLERLEQDLTDMHTRAISWAYGDIETIRALPYVDDRQACSSVWFNSELAQDVGMKDMRARLQSIWLDNAKSSLKKNKSTFAVWPISQLLSHESILNDFADAGYTIEIASPTNDI